MLCNVVHNAIIINCIMIFFFNFQECFVQVARWHCILMDILIYMDTKEDLWNLFNNKKYKMLFELVILHNHLPQKFKFLFKPWACPKLWYFFRSNLCSLQNKNIIFLSFILLSTTTLFIFQKNLFDYKAIYLNLLPSVNI